MKGKGGGGTGGGGTGVGYLRNTPAAPHSVPKREGEGR